MAQEPNQSYGLSVNIFVRRKASDDTIVLGGLAADSTRWTRVLSQRAAQMLWLHLAKLLYPDKSEKISALIVTAPLRDSTRPTITMHITVDKLVNGEYEIVGWIDGQSWEAQIESPEAQRFWSALDLALYPVGWQGRMAIRHLHRSKNTNTLMGGHKSVLLPIIANSTTQLRKVPS